VRSDRSLNEVSILKICSITSCLRYGYFVSIDTPCSVTAVDVAADIQANLNPVNAVDI